MPGLLLCGRGTHSDKNLATGSCKDPIKIKASGPLNLHHSDSGLSLSLACACPQLIRLTTGQTWQGCKWSTGGEPIWVSPPQAVGLLLATLPLDWDTVQGNFPGLSKLSPPPFGEWIFLLDISLSEPLPLLGEWSHFWVHLSGRFLLLWVNVHTL